jgi:hypothetical protein
VRLVERQRSKLRRVVGAEGRYACGNRERQGEDNEDRRPRRSLSDPKALTEIEAQVVKHARLMDRGCEWFKSLRKMRGRGSL